MAHKCHNELGFFIILFQIRWKIKVRVKGLLWAGTTTRELTTNFLLSNFADAHTQHNKKFD